MMATTSSTAKSKPDNQNLTRTRSLGRKPNPVPSSEPEGNADGSDRRTVEKPLPNYLKPTISSRPDPVKFLRKNKAVDDNQKILRRRSYDHPPSSLTSQSTSSRQKSPARPRDRAAVPREKPVTGLRSTSFNGSSRGGLRGGTTGKSPPVALRGSMGVKKSGLSGTSSSKSKKEGSENVPKKSSGKGITPECSPPAPAQEDEEEIPKVETDVQVSDDKEEPKEDDKDQVEQPDESGEEKETSLVGASTEEEKGELINEEHTEEQIEEQKEPENTQENNNQDKEEVDDEENTETVVTPDMKEAANIEETKEEEEAEAKEEDSESSNVKEVTTETKAQVEALPEEGTKKEVVQGKKESPTAYNDVIASKMQQESSRKNKVLALAGAFQTVIDYETAASK